MFNSYKQLITDLKAWGKVVVVSPMTRNQARIVGTLQTMGFVSVTSGEVGLVVKLLPQTVGDDDFVHVSHWTTGKRAGLSAQARYKKVHRYGSWVTYQLTDTMQHVIRIERTQVAA